MSHRISELIEDPRDAEELADDIEESKEYPPEYKISPDATCHTVVMYQLISKMRTMCDSVLKEMDAERARAYTDDEEFVIVAGALAGVEGFEFTSAMVEAIHQLAIVSREYEWWIDEHKQPIPEPLPK